MRPPEPLLVEGGRILAVDDQPENLDLLEELLGNEGYEVTLAADGVAALEAAERNPPDCIVLDIMMPRLDGISVCRALKTKRPTRFIPVVMLTALSEVVDKVRALEAGADDFLNKPFHQAELLARVRSLVRIKRLRDELDTSENIIYSMTEALESKLPANAGHTRRVTWKAVGLARRLMLPDSDVEIIGKGAILHDLGKIGIPERLLQAPAANFEDAAMLRRHPEIGEQILAPLLSFARVREVVRHHHERLDGSGYPDGIAGTELTLAAEIVGIADEHEDRLAEGSAETAARALRESAAKGEFHADLVEEFLALPRTAGERSEPPESWEDLLPVPEGNRPGRILVADDVAANREMIAEILETAGHRVSLASGGQDLLRAVRAEKVDLVLTDVRMPDMDGFAVCRQLKSAPETRFLPVILVTAQQESGDRLRGATEGADDFLTIPLNRLELLARVRSLLRLRTYFQDLEEHQSVILSLATALEAKDPYTRGHSARVGVLASRLAREVGLGEDECDLLNVAGQLHDIGKIGVPERLLHKPAHLSEEEFATIMSHPTRGEAICRPLRTVAGALPYVRHHHERYDGGGYPDGLAGEAIPLGARVLGLADAFDALTSERPYRQTSTFEEALGILARETSAGRWDPKIYGALSAMTRRNSGR